MNNNLRILIFLLTSFLYSCEYNGAAKKERELFLISLLPANSSTATIQCSNQTNFTTLKSVGIVNTCGSCHNASTANAGLDVSNFSSLSAKIVSGSPSVSTLYKAVSAGGVMSQYTNKTLTDSIYCWIKGGGLQ